MLDKALSLFSEEDRKAISDDETGAAAEQIVGRLLDEIDDDMADFLYDEWDTIRTRF